MKIIPDKFYSTSHLMEILDFKQKTILNKLESWEITAYNTGTSNRKIWRIQGQDILDYLEINKN